MDELFCWEGMGDNITFENVGCYVGTFTLIKDPKLETFSIRFTACNELAITVAPTLL